MLRRTLVAAFLLVLGLLAWCYSVATADPAVRRADIAMPDWPAAIPPVRLVLISDIHVQGPDMPPERLERIVAQINRLKPDLVLIAGDLISEKRLGQRPYTMAVALKPLGGLRPRLGSIAVLGNHDHWYDAPGAVAALRTAGVTVLANDAVRIGPVAVGGLDDDFTGRADLPRTLARLRRLGGAKLLLSHSPDPFPDVPTSMSLMLAGHTHCGQISLPLIGPPKTMSKYGTRYACGLIREDGKTLVVGAGLGTSGIPLRFGTEPEMWLLTLGPARPAAAR
ncbi:MAG TPA: metallophosphoesterase [Allosphingosinicella sp.]|uniref:metallophosphoesterase n=1 Tax=Allosphingosinicella sp. TaxID=2823234 RepID=UPI002F27E138